MVALGHGIADRDFQPVLERVALMRSVNSTDYGAFKLIFSHRVVPCKKPKSIYSIPNVPLILSVSDYTYPLLKRNLCYRQNPSETEFPL